MIWFIAIVRVVPRDGKVKGRHHIIYQSNRFPQNPQLDAKENIVRHNLVKDSRSNILASNNTFTYLI